MGSCMTKRDNRNDYLNTMTVEISEDSDLMPTRAADPPFELGNPDYTDEYLKYIAQGGSIERLIECYRPPMCWDEELRRTYPVGVFHETQPNCQTLHTCIIHLNDNLDSTKRHFLSFYNLDVTNMHPEEFMQWCHANNMPNTCADYMSLYSVSRYQGENSKILRNLARSKGVVSICLTDRFTTYNGCFRALVLQSNTIQGMYWLYSAFMSRLDPESYRSVRCAVEPYARRKCERLPNKWF